MADLAVTGLHRVTRHCIAASQVRVAAGLRSFQRHRLQRREMGDLTP